MLVAVQSHNASNATLQLACTAIVMPQDTLAPHVGILDIQDTSVRAIGSRSGGMVNPAVVIALEQAVPDTRRSSHRPRMWSPRAPAAHKPWTAPS